MDKQQFNNLEVLEQIKYINRQLEFKSLRKICESIGIKRKAVNDKFKDVGYTLVGNQYIATDTDTKKANNNNSKTVENTNNISITIEQYNSLEKQIKALEDKYNKLSTTIEKQQNNNCTTEVQQNNNSNEIRFYKNEVVVRAHRIDREVYNRFKAFTDSNKQYKISDIISTALENFLNEYDK